MPNRLAGAVLKSLLDMPAAAATSPAAIRLIGMKYPKAVKFLEVFPTDYEGTIRDFIFSDVGATQLFEHGMNMFMDKTQLALGHDHSDQDIDGEIVRQCKICSGYFLD
jgi:hypothetical protein